MHIVILADPIDNQLAGVHIYTKNLISALLKIDKKNSYSLIHEKENIFFENTKEPNHFIIPRKNFPGYGTWRKFHLIPKLIKKLQPDIVFETAHIGPFRTPCGCKKAVMIHDLTPILFPRFHIKRSTIIHKFFLKNILRKVDLIITASQNTKKDILEYSGTKAKISVIPLGLEQTVKSRHENPAHKYSMISPIIKPYLLYLGTIEPRKNLETLLSAFQQLKSSHEIPHKLVIAGGIGWKSRELTKKIKTTRDIIMTGYISEKEKNSLYKNADIFIYPSLYEGFGLPPLEAMSNGTPVICSDGGSLKEIFSKNCLIFPANNPKMLAGQILKIIKSPKLRKKLSRDGLIFSKKFSWEKTAKMTLKALTD